MDPSNTQGKDTLTGHHIYLVDNDLQLSLSADAPSSVRLMCNRLASAQARRLLALLLSLFFFAFPWLCLQAAPEQLLRGVFVHR